MLLPRLRVGMFSVIWLIAGRTFWALHIFLSSVIRYITCMRFIHNKNSSEIQRRYRRCYAPHQSYEKAGLPTLPTTVFETNNLPISNPILNELRTVCVSNSYLDVHFAFLFSWKYFTTSRNYRFEGLA